MNEHHVEFYSGSHEVLALTVGQYIAEGLMRGAATIVIARPEHTEAFKKFVRDKGFDHEGIISLDAEDTLALFMKDRRPVWSRFHSLVEPIIDRAAASANGAGITLYGEMVDILWQQGNLSGAVELENHWNRLLEGRNAELYCAYKADVLATDVGGMNAILLTHSHLASGGNGELEKAVLSSMENVLGASQVAALKPLIAANLTRGAKLPWAEAAVLWLRNHLPEQAESVISQTRSRLAGAF